MTFYHLTHLDRFLSDHKAGRNTNDSIALIERSPLTPCFRIIGVHKLTPGENDGKHNLYIDVLNAAGIRIQKLIEWGWEGQQPGEVARPLVLDKPPNEPSGNLVIWAGQTIWARVLNQPSDIIYNVTTGLPDEGPGSTWGHHSYYAAWMWSEAEPVVTPPDEPPAPDGCGELQQDYDELRATLRAIRGLLDRI